MLSIIIPTYNRNDLLAECLDCLHLSLEKFSSATVEVIVTDDSPNEGAKAMLESNYQWVKWYEGPKKGPASNRNSGASKAQFDWFIFIDDDCLPTPGFIRGYYNEIVKGKYRVYEGAIDVDRPKARYDEQSPINLGGGNFWSCNICLEKSLYTELGGFDENFPFAALEDTDLHIRVKKLAQIGFVKEALVIHPWRKMGVFKMYKKQLASYRYFDSKHPVESSANYHLQRIKLLVGFTFTDFKKLAQFSFKGYKFYFELVYLKFLMIFQ